MADELRDIQKRWTALADQDPFWAALTDRQRGGWTADAFARDGETEIRGVLDLLERLRIPVGRGAALDFGCGPGRLTGALAAAGFSSATGIDISEPMVQRAQETFPDPRCTFIHNQAPDLGCIPSRSMDLVYSCRVLQHMPTMLSRGYIREFLRVSAPEGVVVFQLPVRPKPGPFALANRLLPGKALDRLRHGMAMHAMEVDDVLRVVAGSGGLTLWVEPDTSAGPRWISRLYVVRRSELGAGAPG